MEGCVQTVLFRARCPSMLRPMQESQDPAAEEPVAKADREAFGKRLKRFRNNAHRTRPDVTRLCKVPVATLQSWEDGVRTPSVFGVQKLARVYGVGMDELVGSPPVLPTDSRLVDEQTANAILATTDPEVIRDHMNWDPDIVLLMPKIPPGSVLMDHDKGDVLDRRVQRHIEKYAPALRQEWIGLHDLPEWWGAARQGEDDGDLVEKPPASQ